MDGLQKQASKLAAIQEHQRFVQKVQETGIGQYLTGQALMLLFISLGDKMWRSTDDLPSSSQGAGQTD